jgi:hypothetical protein
VATLVAASLLGFFAAWQWWGTPMQPLHRAVAAIRHRASQGEPLHAAQRHYLAHGPGLLIGQAALAFQLYDLVATLCVADLRSTLMVNRDRERERERGRGG